MPQQIPDPKFDVGDPVLISWGNDKPRTIEGRQFFPNFTVGGGPGSWEYDLSGKPGWTREAALRPSKAKA
jgi:hypothetical protein